ncbi:hypothetical protein SOVF_075230 [Spinacia oleracea]|nr:hypothetical protein SOVF_075230 [Spinacia oleracea]
MSSNPRPISNVPLPFREAGKDRKRDANNGVNNQQTIPRLPTLLFNLMIIIYYGAYPIAKHSLICNLWTLPFGKNVLPQPLDSFILPVE